MVLMSCSHESRTVELMQNLYNISLTQGVSGTVLI